MHALKTHQIMPMAALMEPAVMAMPRARAMTLALMVIESRMRGGGAIKSICAALLLSFKSQRTLDLSVNLSWLRSGVIAVCRAVQVSGSGRSQSDWEIWLAVLVFQGIPTRKRQRAVVLAPQQRLDMGVEKRFLRSSVERVGVVRATK